MRELPIHFKGPMIRAIGRMLSLGHKEYFLERSRIGLHGAEAGFPKWVYVYKFIGL